MEGQTRLTAAPNSRLTGKAARNCAIGCTASAQRGLRPIQTLIGTQITRGQRHQHDDAQQV